MGTVTKREVWNWLRENGPATFAEVRDAFENEDMAVACIRDMNSSEHVTHTLDWEWEANDTNSLSNGVSPFGAGGGTHKNEKPARGPPESHYL